MATSWLGSIAYGEGGVRQTLDVMRRLVNGREGIHNPTVVEFAQMLTSTGAARDYSRMARTIQSWLADHVQFVADAAGTEQLRTPYYSVLFYERNGVLRGDCDDVAVLGAALGKAVGLAAMFVAVAFDHPATHGLYSHVFTVLLTPDGEEVTLDVTRPAAPAPPVLRTLTMTV